MSLQNVKLSVAQVYNLSNALSALDGYKRVIRDGTAEKVELIGYTLDGKKVRLRAAKNINRLTPILKSFETARDGLFNEHLNGSEKLEGAAAREYTKQLDDMLSAEEEVELHMLDLDDLKLTVNPIPGTVLAGLAPVLIETAEAERTEGQS